MSYIRGMAFENITQTPIETISELNKLIINMESIIEKENLVINSAIGEYEHMNNDFITIQNLISSNNRSISKEHFNVLCSFTKNISFKYNLKNINLSNENYNYKNTLQYSQEGLKDMANKVWEKIKAFFNWILETINNLIRNIMKFFGFKVKALERKQQQIKNSNGPAVNQPVPHANVAQNIPPNQNSSIAQTNTNTASNTTTNTPSVSTATNVPMVSATVSIQSTPPASITPSPANSQQQSNSNSPTQPPEVIKNNSEIEKKFVLQYDKKLKFEIFKLLPNDLNKGTAEYDIITKIIQLRLAAIGAYKKLDIRKNINLILSTIDESNKNNYSKDENDTICQKVKDEIFSNFITSASHYLLTIDDSKIPDKIKMTVNKFNNKIDLHKLYTDDDFFRDTIKVSNSNMKNNMEAADKIFNNSLETSPRTYVNLDVPELIYPINKENAIKLLDIQKQFIKLFTDEISDFEDMVKANKFKVNDNKEEKSLQYYFASVLKLNTAIAVRLNNAIRITTERLEAEISAPMKLYINYFYPDTVK